MIFIDTGALYALVIPADANHAAAVEWYASGNAELVTTDFVVYEFVTLMRRRGHNELGTQVGSQLLKSELATLICLTRSDVEESWNVFAAFNDKEWSFTDCTSRVAMQRLGIVKAFAFDDRFRQFGTVAVVP